MNGKTDFASGINKTFFGENLSPSTPSKVIPGAPVEECEIMVDLDQIDESEDDYNPRLTENELFEDIKASIAVRGVDVPVTVTQRPGSNLYIRKAGGKTRCKALRQLYAETGNHERFGQLRVKFKPWKGEVDLRMGFATENIRSGLNFYEQAAQEKGLRELICQQTPLFAKATVRERHNHYKTLGLTIDRSYLTCFDYVFESLHPVLEKQLLSGMTIRTVKSIKAIEQKFRKTVLSNGNEAHEDFQSAFKKVIKKYSKIDGAFDLNKFEKDLAKETAKTVDIDPDTLIRDQKKTKLHAPEQPQPVQPPPTTPQETSGAEQRASETPQASQPNESTPSPDIVKTPSDRPNSQSRVETAPQESAQASTEDRLTNLREEGLRVASILASDHGLIGGSFHTLENIALGYCLDTPDHVSILERDNGLQSICVYLELHSLFWSVFNKEIETGRVNSEAENQIAHDAHINSILTSETYRKIPQADMYTCLNTLRLNAAVDRSRGVSSPALKTIDNLDTLRSISEAYAVILGEQS